MITVPISKVQNSFYGLRWMMGVRGFTKKRKPLFIKDTGLLKRKNAESL
jgi:hypothetical protein